MGFFGATKGEPRRSPVGQHAGYLSGHHKKSQVVISQKKTIVTDPPVRPPRPKVSKVQPKSYSVLSPKNMPPPHASFDTPYSVQCHPPHHQMYASDYQLPPTAQPLPISYQQLGIPNKISSSTMNVSSMLQLGPDMPPCVPGAQYFNDGVADWQHKGTQLLNQSAALYDQISAKFNRVLTLIDGEQFSGEEKDLWLYKPAGPQWDVPQIVNTLPQESRAIRMAKGSSDNEVVARLARPKDGCPVAAAVANSNYFSRVNLYANSRLPPHLPPVKLDLPTFPLLCVAAQYSEHVYSKATAFERTSYINADWRMGTKAMLIKSIPMDHMQIIVFSIRGSQTFLDWAVNLNSAPVSPEGFLDDGGNFCHAGFLSVARKMIKPVADRLRTLLTEDPSRIGNYSLLITGHSAGGAVAALLYSHMLATSTATKSELNHLTACFKRIHCITFGAPPVSLLPLKRPCRSALRKSLFLSFVNEGDPVVRAYKAYVKSLLDLYTKPIPGPAVNVNGGTLATQKSRINLQRFNKASAVTYPPAEKDKPVWEVPPSTLSNAGRLILLRSVRRVTEEYAPQKKNKKQERVEMMDDGVQARSITDELLRGVIWGDPVCHMMKLYARRIEILATNAVIGKS